MIEKLVHREFRDGFRQRIRHFTQKIRGGFYDMFRPKMSEDLLEDNAGFNYLHEGTVSGIAAGLFITVSGSVLNNFTQAESTDLASLFSNIATYPRETVGATTVLVTSIFAYPLVFHR